jgi:putative membrane protein
MSIRQYQPRNNRRRGISANQSMGLILLFAIAIGLQISYPLISGTALRYITIFTVISGALLMLAHSLLSYGFRYFATFACVTFIFALLIEILGSKTGWPFGTYAYDDSLGFKIAGVPVIVPFAWIMMAHPVLIAARKTIPSWAFLYGGAGLMVWDLFLDPQMVAAGRWSWDVVGPHVPFQPEIPLSNTAGWLFAGMGLMALLNLILPKERRKSGINSTVPDLFLAWTLFSGVIGNLLFFDRAGVALIGGIAFVIWAAPYLFVISFGKPDLLK